MSLETMRMWYFLKQRYDRLPPVVDHIHATATFEHVWETLGHTVIGGS